MAGAGDLKVDLVLALELDFAVIQAAGEKHRAVKTNERVAVEAAKFLTGIQLCHFDASLHCHSVCPRLEVGSMRPRKLNYTENRVCLPGPPPEALPAGYVLELFRADRVAPGLPSAPQVLGGAAIPARRIVATIPGCRIVCSGPAKSLSVSRTTLGSELLKRSSAGMRSSHCCSVSLFVGREIEAYQKLYGAGSWQQASSEDFGLLALDLDFGLGAFSGVLPVGIRQLPASSRFRRRDRTSPVAFCRGGTLVSSLPVCGVLAGLFLRLRRTRKPYTCGPWRSLRCDWPQVKTVV